MKNTIITLKQVISFAHLLCLIIIGFGFFYYALVTYMAFTHTSLPAIVTEIKGDVNIWVTAAIMFVIGSTAGSQRKDATIANLNDNVKQALASTPPVQATTPLLQVNAITPAVTETEIKL